MEYLQIYSAGKDMSLNKITARSVVATALLMWLTSLAFTGIALYSNKKSISGIEILLAGWLSPLVFNFAWYANIFFLYSAFRISAGKCATKSAIFAAIVSLDMLRISVFPSAAGYGSVYGYGWGAFIWLLSMFMLVIAAGLSRRENRRAGITNRKTGFDTLLPIGLSIFISTIVLVSYFAIHDRILANSDEATHLAGIAFKRGDICSVSDNLKILPIDNPSGALDVIIEPPTLIANYPFKKVESYLTWGVPIVRFGSTDFSFYESNNERLITSKEASTPSAATLRVTESKDYKTIHAILVETSTQRVVFDRTWTNIDANNSSRYCPNFNSPSGAGNEPRSLFEQAFNLSALKPEPLKQQSKVFNSVVGEIIGREDRGLTRSDRLERTPGLLQNDEINTNCPDDIGWDISRVEAWSDLGPPFKIRNNTHYIPYRRYWAHFSTCSEDAVYIYMGTRKNEKYYLHIEKRALSDFHTISTGIVGITDKKPFPWDNSLTVKSVKEVGGLSTFELLNEKTGEILTVNATLQPQSE